MNELKAIANSISKIITGIKRNNKDIKYQVENMRGYKGDPKLFEKSKAQNGRYKNLVERRADRYNKVYTLFLDMLDALHLDLNKTFEIKDLTEVEISTIKGSVTPAKMKALCKKKLDHYNESSKALIDKSFTDGEWSMIIEMKEEFETLARGHNFVRVNVKAKAVEMFT